MSIVWLRTNGLDSSAGYDFIVYTSEEGNNSQNGQMLERNRYHFNTLSEAIPGLSVANPLVNWGITSANCTETIHEIEFVSLENSDNIFKDFEVFFEKK